MHSASDAVIIGDSEIQSFRSFLHISTGMQQVDYNRYKFHESGHPLPKQGDIVKVRHSRSIEFRK